MAHESIETMQERGAKCCGWRCRGGEIEEVEGLEGVLMSGVEVALVVFGVFGEFDERFEAVGTAGGEVSGPERDGQRVPASALVVTGEVHGEAVGEFTGWGGSGGGDEGGFGLGGEAALGEEAREAPQRDGLREAAIRGRCECGLDERKQRSHRVDVLGVVIEDGKETLGLDAALGVEVDGRDECAGDVGGSMDIEDMSFNGFEAAVGQVVAPEAA